MYVISGRLSAVIFKITLAWVMNIVFSSLQFTSSLHNINNLLDFAARKACCFYCILRMGRDKGLGQVRIQVDLHRIEKIRE